MSNKMWKKLGFRENPYDTKPLSVSKSDVELLLGRDSEQIDFLTAIESDSQGVFILSGVPGVGKTSFLNVQQYLLESEEAEFGPKMLAARNLCPVQPSDEPKNIAFRCLQSYCKSIEEYCSLYSKTVPPETQKIIAWSYQNKSAVLNIGFSSDGGFNTGREVSLPPIQETPFEIMADIIGTIAQEVKNELGLTSSFIVLDNMENLYDEDLIDCLTTFRDTLFNIPNVWWILIGQSGLSSLIQSTNPKVFQRLSSFIELKPILVDDLIKAVDIRVNRFHETESNGSSPISKEIYLKLFESSNGEIRFVFKYCQSICLNLVQTVRKVILEEKKNWDDKTFERIMGKYLVNKEVNDSFANQCLNNIISEEFNLLYLSQQEKAVLHKIGSLKRVKPKDHEHFREIGISTMQIFITNYLTRLSDLHLLFRRQEGKVITYELTGISVFASEYDLLKD